eukprot:TRINITY_DN6213_c0_g4_i2.p1 TRINITY_DN6213_c0_g4~~TRINITY_DN6213_c0_g4_i2.p1  ORF type:complete len:529 (+),score=108.98 TRINITY_DN6213_c0_g4_i2:171-1757(+)
MAASPSNKATRTDSSDFRFTEFNGKEFSVFIFGPTGAGKKTLLKALYLTSLEDAGLQKELASMVDVIRLNLISLMKDYLLTSKLHSLDLKSSSLQPLLTEPPQWNEQSTNAVVHLLDGQIRSKLTDLPHHTTLNYFLDRFSVLKAADYMPTKTDLLMLKGKVSDIELYPNHRRIQFGNFNCRLFCMRKDELKWHPAIDTGVLIILILDVSVGKEEFERTLTFLSEAVNSPHFSDPMNNWFTLPIFLLCNKTSLLKAQLEKGTSWMVKPGTQLEGASKFVEEKLHSIFKARRYYFTFLDLLDDGDQVTVKNLNFMKKAIVSTLNDASEARLLAFHDLYGTQSLKDYVKKKSPRVNAANLMMPQQVSTSKTILKQFPSLTKALISHTFITEVNFRYNWLPDKLLQDLFEAIKECKSIKVLNISGNNFSTKDDVVIPLVHCLSTNQSLSSLIMNDCFLTDESIAPLLEGLKSIENLTLLDISSNHEITSGSMNHLTELLVSNKNLLYLSLWNTRINDLGVKYLAQKARTLR